MAQAAKYDFELIRKGKMRDGNAFRLFAQQMKLKMTLGSREPAALPLPGFTHSKWKRKYLSCNRDAPVPVSPARLCRLLTRLLIC